MKFCANLTTMFKELDIYQRFYEAKKHGFDTVECLFPYHHDINKIKGAMEDTGLKMLGMDFVPGDFYNGEIGMLNNPEKIDEYKRGVELSIKVALDLGVKKMNCLVGKRLPGISIEKQMETIVDNLIYTSEQMKPHNLTLLIEPINSVDNPGYICDTCEKASDIIQKVNTDNIALLFDVYHLYRMGHDVIGEFKKYRGIVNHVHISDCPNRTEPGKGEIPFDVILPAIDEYYKDYIGLEYTNIDSVFGNLPIE
ncbi:TIM barrel protein [Wukongibacter baidiensis]|uniref:hydroxypyruvate isomerase family protein n=1 Tax=Wukongibacter baidiensis TaxID=1723361 RepID=UPI003D7F2827